MDAAVLEAEQKKITEVGDRLKAELAKSMDQRDAALAERLTKEFDAHCDKVLEDVARANPRVSVTGVEYDADGTKKGKAFSLARAAVAVKRGVWDGAGYEREVFNQTEKDFHTKALQAGVDMSGGFLVPSQVSDRVIEKLLPRVIAFQLGVGRIQMGYTGSLSFNRETDTPTAYWVGEMQTITASQGKLGQMKVEPKRVGAKCDISNLLLMEAGGANGAEQWFVKSASRQLALAWDRAILIGATSNQGPVGIANTLGVQTSSGATATFNKVVAFIGKLRTANALVGNSLGWALSPTKLEEIEVMVDAANQPLVRRAVDGGTIDRIRGYRFETSTQLGTTGPNTMIFGAWDMASAFEWFGGLILKRSDTSDTALDSDVTRVVVQQYGDVGVEQPSAFCVASD